MTSKKPNLPPKRTEEERRRYCAGKEFYETNTFVLPDGRVVQADEWSESYPPIPRRIKLSRWTKHLRQHEKRLSKA